MRARAMDIASHSAKPHASGEEGSCSHGSSTRCRKLAEAQEKNGRNSEHRTRCGSWGEVPYPVQYVYDDFGRRVEMHTYRADLNGAAEGDGFEGAHWPDGASVAADVTTWDYEEATGNLLSKSDAAGEGASITYDEAGRVRTRTAARMLNGQANRHPIVFYNYEPDTGALASLDYRLGPVDATYGQTVDDPETPDVSFEYDRLGRPVTVTDGQGEHTIGYDPDGLQLASETIESADDDFDSEVHRLFEDPDVPGRLTGVALPSEAYALTYRYDNDALFGGIDWNVGGAQDSVTYHYINGSHLLERFTTTSGRTTDYDYETQRDRRTLVHHTFGASSARYDSSYDDLGRPQSIRNSGNAFSVAAFSIYGHDDRNQVTTEARYLGTDVTNLSQPVTSRQRSFGFDPIGNRTEVTEGTATTDVYATSQLNQYTAVTGNGSKSFAHDADGNMTALTENGVTRTFRYDGQNRLIEVAPQTPANGDTRSRFRYDYRGRRYSKVVETYDGSAWNETRAHAFVYSGWNLLKETVREGSATRTKRYVWGLDQTQDLVAGGGVGGLLAIVDSEAGVLHAQADGLGNVTQLVEPDGDIVARYEYDAFGRTVAMSGGAAEDNAFRFSSKYADDDTGLVYYGLRYYSVALGRWTSRDPMEEAGGLNLYGFVGNSSLVLFDLLGMCDVEQIARDALWELGKGQAEKILYKALGKAGAKFAIAAIADGPLPVGELIGIGLAAWDIGSAIRDIRGLRRLLTELEGQIFQHLTPELEEALRDKLGSCCDKFSTDVTAVIKAKMARRGVVSELRSAFKELKDCCGIPGKKRRPKTDPNAPHNRTIREEADRLEAQGNTIIAGGGREREVLIDTPDGHRDGRRPDILYETPDGSVRGRQVGRTRADGSPVTREQQALDDLNGPGGIPTDFVGYD